MVLAHRPLTFSALLISGCLSAGGDSAWLDVDDLDSASSGDTGDWIPLGFLYEDPAWESEDDGVATGLGFADFDGDGDADLAVSYGNDIQAGPVVIYENHGGVLETEPSWIGALDRFHGHLSTGDMNGDGWIDLVVSVFLGETGWDDPGGVDVYLNQGGQLESVPSWSVRGFYSFSNALGDIDLDGDLDLVAAAGEAYFHSPDRTRLYLNNGSGDLGEQPEWTTEADRHSFDAAFYDANSDGWLDLALANSGSPHCVFFGGPDGLSSSPGWEAQGSQFEGNTLDWGDLDGDGQPDLVISENQQIEGDGRVRVYCGPDLETCWESEDTPAMQSAVSLEDLDGDGALELVAGAWWGEGSATGEWGHVVRVYDQEDGVLEVVPSWRSTPSNIVVEAFAWADLDGSSHQEKTIEGRGLVAIPGRARVLEVEGGVAGDGYISGPGKVWARYLEPARRDLAVSDWNRENGNLLFGQRAQRGG